MKEEEEKDIKPLRLSIVRPPSGERAEEVARRMVIADRPLEHFLLLNGLEAAGPLSAGESYKIVVD